MNATFESGSPALIEVLRDRLYPLRDESRAVGMAGYMQDLFPFLGIDSTRRRQAVKDLLARRPLDWELVDACWDEPEREFQYVAVDHLRRQKLPAAELDTLKVLITSKSWWDTVDHLAKVAGTALRTEPDAARPILASWATDPDLWVRRVGILCQLGFAKVGLLDKDVLTQAINANLPTSPTCLRWEEHPIAGPGPKFFIEKAIGWALRDVAHHDPDWVQEFCRAFHADLSPLSRREALKNLH